MTIVANVIAPYRNVGRVHIIYVNYIDNHLGGMYAYCIYTHMSIDRGSDRERERERERER